MDISLNLNKVKKLKTHKKFLGTGFILTSAGSVMGFLHNTMDKLAKFQDAIINSPDSIGVFQKIFNKYGCENKAEFDSFLQANSTTYHDTVIINGVPTPWEFTRYNAQAQPAYNEFTNAQTALQNLPLDGQLEYIGIGLDDVAMFAIVPTIFMAGYLIKRHQYKKAYENTYNALAEKEEKEMEK